MASVEALYIEVAPAVLRWFRGRVANADIATDLLAETYAQVVCGIGTFRGDTFEQATAWVWGIARNLLRHYYREQRVEQVARSRLGMLAAGSSSAADENVRPDPAVGSALRDAMAKLPDQTRTCVWMRLVDDAPYREIAEALSCSEHVVRQRVSRGLRKLAIYMEEAR